MGPSTAASSIAQVSREVLRVEKLRGSVQTVFPIHACMPPTANNSETQDYGTVGSDGPIEGATKVFQVTLRDFGVPSHTNNRNNNAHHRINAYFYDQWADDHHASINPGDELEISGPAARLIRPDASAAGNGDHPFCLVFHTGGDDALLALGAVAADHLVGGAGGGSSDARGGSAGACGAVLADDVVSCRIVRKAVQPGQRVGAGARSGVAAAEAARGRGIGGRGGSRPGARTTKASYEYTSLDSLRVQEEKTHVYGVVCSFTHRHQSRGRDMTNSVSLLDETCAESDGAVPCNFFSSSAKGLPAPVMVGDIVRLHRAKVQEYRGRPQLLATGGTAWLVIRKKQAARETFQKVPVGCNPAAAAVAGAGCDDEDPDPGGDSPPSGPDAGGGEADAMLPPSEWEVQASSPNYTLSQVDQDRCNALSAWMSSKAPHLWLKQSSDAKVWVKDIFRRPPSGPVISETEVDLVCCLTSKHERAGGGAGSLSEVYVADGTGFAPSMGSGVWDERRDAALLKGMRAAMGKPDWSPKDPRPPPFPAHLKVEVLENRMEWEALALSPGMWIRLRRLTITKNRQTGNMSAKMKDKGSSVNPLHPTMAEVQHIAVAHAIHFSASTSGRGGGGNGGCNGGAEIGTGIRRALVVPPNDLPPRPAAAPAAAAAVQATPAAVPAAVAPVAATAIPSTQPAHPNPTNGSDVSSDDRDSAAPEATGGPVEAASEADSGRRETGACSAGPGRIGEEVVTASSRGRPGSQPATTGGQRFPSRLTPAGAAGAAAATPAPPVVGAETAPGNGLATSRTQAAWPRSGLGGGGGGGAGGQCAGSDVRGSGAVGSGGGAVAGGGAGRRLSNGGVGAGVGSGGGGGGDSARGRKRAVSEEGPESRAGAAEGDGQAAAKFGRRLSHLGIVRSTTAPHVFDTRARLVSHWPPKVEDFAREGPGWGDGPRFLFTLKLEDDYGVVEAVAAGPDASRLLPGAPSPAEFHASADVRARVERLLTDLESGGRRADGGDVDLRLRSYLAPLVGIGQRGEKCKRYSIVAPSCLATGPHAKKWLKVPAVSHAASNQSTHSAGDGNTRQSF